MGLIGGVNEVYAGYKDEEAAYFLDDYGGPGFFIPVHILPDSVMRRQNPSRSVDSL